MTSLTIDDDVVRWSVDPALVPDLLGSRPLLVLMHGFGSFEGDLIGLAPRLPSNFVVASPRAPLVAPEPIENGFGWFLPKDGPGYPTEEEAQDAVTAVLAWLDRLAERASGPLGPVAIAGFSQGGAMVTQLFRNAPERFAAGGVFSGFVPPYTGAGDDALASSRPPLFLGFDPEDPLFAPGRVQATEAFLAEHFALESHHYAGIGHSVAAQEVADFASFLDAAVVES